MLNKLLYFFLFLFLLQLPIIAKEEFIQIKVNELNVRYTENNTNLNLKGFIKNIHSLPLRGIKPYINILDKQKIIVKIPLEEITFLKSNSIVTFNLDYTILNKHYYELSAKGGAEFSALTYIDISNFILGKQKYMLDLWQISYNSEIFTNEELRVKEAIKVLYQIKPDNSLFKEAKEKYNLILYNYAQRLIETQNYHDGILNLLKIEHTSKLYNQAKKLINKYRIIAMYKKALKKVIKEKDYIYGVEVLSKIPKNTYYYNLAQKKIKVWKEIIKVKKLKKVPKKPDKKLSYSQLKIWLRYKEPELMITHQFWDKIYKIWVYQDYSYFIFKNGKIVCCIN